MTSDSALRVEDQDHTLIFVDMLGFAALTERYPFRVIHDTGPNKYGFYSSRTGPIQNRITIFQNRVDHCVFNNSMNGNIHAMLFSDCAFIDAVNSVYAALIAGELMRECIKQRVPTRMGLGRGTFYPLTFSTETDGSIIVSRSRFAGTAAVRAHEAERCGGKGMRIFLHPSMEADVQMIGNTTKVLPLPRPYEHARWELSYLCGPRPTNQEAAAQAGDKELFESVASMDDQSAPPRIRRHYTQTFKALNRMRKANSRSEINVKQLRSRFAGDG